MGDFIELDSDGSSGISDADKESKLYISKTNKSRAFSNHFREILFVFES